MSKKVNFRNQDSAADFARKCGTSHNLENDGKTYSVTVPSKGGSKSSGSRGGNNGDPHFKGNIEQPSLRPDGTDGDEWDDYAWSADDF